MTSSDSSWSDRIITGVGSRHPRRRRSCSASGGSLTERQPTHMITQQGLSTLLGTCVTSSVVPAKSRAFSRRCTRNKMRVLARRRGNSSINATSAWRQFPLRDHRQLGIDAPGSEPLAQPAILIVADRVSLSPSPDIFPSSSRYVFPSSSRYERSNGQRGRPG